MGECIVVGCDLHEKTMLLKLACGRGAAVRATWRNTTAGQEAMVEDLKRRALAAGGVPVVFAYEASGLGFGLHDVLTEAGIACHVLAPTKLARSPKQRRAKCDERDAERILELLRGHVLAGNGLPSVWVPDVETREDREVVRARLDARQKTTKVKIQVQALLKRHGLRRPKETGKGWTVRFRSWLRLLTRASERLPSGGRVALGTLLRQLTFLEEETQTLEAEVSRLSQKRRYAEVVARMMQHTGVGRLTAMVVLTEMGDLRRFTSRKEIGAYLGLVPSSDDTGESEHKGHITHQGPWRVRWMLCQAVWAHLRLDAEEQDCYDRIAARNPKHRKIAVVACMRRLAIRLWHIGATAQQEGRVFDASPALAG
jgi:transposase